MKRNVALTVISVLVVGSCAAPLHLDEGAYRSRTYDAPGEAAPVPPPPKPAVDASPMRGVSLGQARELALLRNHTVRAAAATVASARAAIAEARAAFLPTLSGSITRAHYRESSEVTIPGITTFTVTPSLQTTGTAQLAVSLFSGGRDWEEVKAARAALTTQILDERSVRQQLLLEVTRAWYRLHEATAQVQVSRDQFTASARQLEDARNVVAAGRATKDSELTAKVEVLRSRQEVLVSENAVVHARRVINVLLVRSLDAETSLDEPPAFRKVQLDNAHLVAMGREHNPSLLAFRSQRIALGHQRESVLRSITPEIVGALGASYNSFKQATGYSTNYSALLVAQWTPIDGGRRIGRLQQIHADLIALRERELQAIQDLDLRIERTLLDIAESESAVELAHQSISASTENYRIVSERFRNGKVTTRELLEAQTTLSSSRFVLNQARFGHLTLLAALEAQIGVEQADWVTYEGEGK